MAVRGRCRGGEGAVRRRCVGGEYNYDVMEVFIYIYLFIYIYIDIIYVCYLYDIK